MRGGVESWIWIMFNNGFQTSLSDKLKMVECLFDLDFLERPKFQLSNIIRVLNTTDEWIMFDKN